MKRIFLTILTLLLLIPLISCSGGGKPTAFEIAEKLLSGRSDVPPYRIYSAASADSLSESDFSFLYTGAYGECPALGLIDDYCILLSQRPQIFELHVIRAKDPKDTEHLVKLLEKRRKLIEAYSYRAGEEDQSDFSGTDVSLIAAGRWIILAAMPDSEATVGAAGKLLK